MNKTTTFHHLVEPNRVFERFHARKVGLSLPTPLPVIFQTQSGKEDSSDLTWILPDPSI